MAIASKQSVFTRWRKGFLALGVVVVLLVVGYFVLGSPAFLRSVVLPRVGRAMNAEILVGDISLQPFSQLRVRQLKVTPAGQSQPLLEADEVLVRYQFMSLLSGKYVIPEVRLTTPKIQILQTADGKSNLDALGSKTDQSPRHSTEPLALSLGRLTVSGGEFRFTNEQKDGMSQVSELRALAFTLENLAPNANAKGKVEVEVFQTMSGGASLTNGAGRIQARLGGNFEFRADAELHPTGGQGDLRLSVTSASGVFGDLAGVGAQLAGQVEAKADSRISLAFDRQGRALGQIVVAGQLDWATRKGRATLDVTGIDRSVLNLVGAAYGLDFAESSLSSTMSVELGGEGKATTFDGRVSGKRLGVRIGGQATPPIDLELILDFKVESAEKTLTIRRFQLSGDQSGERVLDAALKDGQEMRLWWGDEDLRDKRRPIKYSSSLFVTNTLNLAQWGMFLGTNPPTGRISTGLLLTTDPEGKQLTGEMTIGLTNLAVMVDGNRWEQLHGVLRTVNLELLDRRLVQLNKLQIDLWAADKPLLRGSGNVVFDRISRDTKLQLSAEAELPTLLRKMPVPGLQADAGKLVVSGGYTQDQRQQGVSFTLNLAGLNAQYGQFQFRNYDLRLDSTLALTPETIDLRRLALSAQLGTQPGGAIDLSGKINRANGVSDWSFLAANLNQRALDPFLAPMIAPLTLRSGALDAKGTAHIDPAGRSTVDIKNADFLNVMLADPQQRTPAKALDFHASLTGSAEGQRYEVSQGRLALSPTDRATNVLNFEARIDLAPNQPQPSTVKLTADTLDLTPLYNAFSARAAVPSGAPGSTVPKAPPAAATGEAPALTLQPRRLTTDVKIGRLYLRELVLNNVVASGGLSNDVFTLAPVTMTMNGAPVSAAMTAELGVPGYAYRFKLDADKVPVAPLLSLADFTVENPLRGNVSAALNFRGAGTTGDSLAKKLQGQFDLGSTNLNLIISAVQSRLLKSIVNVVVGLPGLVKNPAARLGNLLGDLAGARRATPGWVDDVTQSPISTILLRGSVGNGRVELQQSLVESPAFRAEAAGSLALAPVLTNSTVDLPVQIALRAPLAEKIGLQSTEGPLAYVKLPDFLTIKGSLGDPKTQIKALALAGITARASAGLLGNSGNPNLDKAASLLGTVGSLLGGGLNAPTNTPATNARPAVTSAPAVTNSPPRTNRIQSPAGAPVPVTPPKPK